MVSRYLILVALIISTVYAGSIYDQYYTQAKSIAEGMTLDQKIGQTIQANFDTLNQKQRNITVPDKAVQWNLGSLLISGNAAPTTDGNLGIVPLSIQYEKTIQYYSRQTVANWKKFTDRFTNIGVKVTAKDGKKYLIKFLLGTDAVHGDQHTLGNILFPHNIGLSCTRNPDHYKNVGFWVKESLKKVGFNYAFAPTVATSHNPQWGRYYQTNGQQPNYISQYAKAYVQGLQDIRNGKINGAIGSAKHFLGDGATKYGCNQGSVTAFNISTFVKQNVQGYIGASQSDVGSVMASYSGINFVPNSLNSYFLQQVLRQQAGFGGFVISDYNELQRTVEQLLPRTWMNYTQMPLGYRTMMYAGVDMLMLSKQIQKVIKQGKTSVQRGFVSDDRLNEAVIRILQVKLAMGLITSLSQPQPEQKKQIESIIPTSSSGNQYQDSLNAVHESLVLLKNSNNIIPASNIRSGIKHVFLIGERIYNLNRLTKIRLYRIFDDIGSQCGGWSIAWQGFMGNQFWQGDNKKAANASSILDALNVLQTQYKFEIHYPKYSTLTNQLVIDEQRRRYISEVKNMKKDLNARNTIIIGAFGQFPYAESVGDVNIPYCKLSNPQGCLYRASENLYAPSSQKKTLNLEMDSFQSQVLSTIRQADQNIPLISVILSGRPLLIDKIINQSNAVIASWLPGTSGGQGIMNAIVGDYVIRPKGSSDKVNSLSMDWPRDMASLQNFPEYNRKGDIPRIQNPLFSVGYGLSSAVSKQELLIDE